MDKSNIQAPWAAHHKVSETLAMMAEQAATPEEALQCYAQAAAAETVALLVTSAGLPRTVGILAVSCVALHMKANNDLAARDISERILSADRYPLRPEHREQLQDMLVDIQQKLDLLN